MTKINFIKGKNDQICIFTLGLTNINLGFRVKGWGFGDNVSNLKKKY